VLAERGHEIVGYNDHHDAVLVFIEPTRQWKRDVRVVQRLDGIWFKPEQFETHNRLIKWAYDNCDAVVWQSKFDQAMTYHHWGHREGKVIGNGIDADKVKLSNARLRTIRRENEKVFVCSANWHRQKRLKENIEAYDILSKGVEKSCLIVMGSNPDYVIERSNIIYTENIKHSLCLEIYAMSDAMIHLAWLDHCPNVVVEAISQKCPVICTDSGGTKEIVGNSGLVIPEIQPYNFELTDYDDPYPIDLSMLEEFDLSQIEVNSKNICLQKVADEYENILSKE